MYTALGVLAAVALFFGTGCEAAALGIFAALWYITDAAGVPLDTLRFSVILLASLSGPIAGLAAGALLQRFCEIESRLPLFRLTGVLLGYSAFFFSGRSGAWIELLVHGAPGRSDAVLFLALLNRLVLCSAVVAMCLILVMLAFEIPARWISRPLQPALRTAFVAVRPILALFAVSAAIDLIVPFVAAEINPQAALATVAHE